MCTVLGDFVLQRVEGGGRAVRGGSCQAARAGLIASSWGLKVFSGHSVNTQLALSWVPNPCSCRDEGGL